MDELRRTLSLSLRLILFLTLPASVGLMILGKPLVTFLFEHGAFTAASTDVTVAALLFYSIGLFAHSGIEILSRGFYALSDTRTPVAFAVTSMIANLILCLIFVGPFGVRGLGLALSLSAILEFYLLFRVLRRRTFGLDEGHIINSVTRMVAATVLMAETVGLYMIFLQSVGALNHGQPGRCFPGPSRRRYRRRRHLSSRSVSIGQRRGGHHSQPPTGAAHLRLARPRRGERELSLA